MDSTLKQRLIGAAVLAALAVIFLPMLLQGPDVKVPDAAEVPLSMPSTPGQEFETRELPLTTPEGAAPPGGVLGMAPAPVPATVDDPDSAPVVDGSAVADADPPETAEPADAPSALVPSTLPAVAPKPVAPSAVGAGNYVVNIGSFSNLSNATALAAKLRAAQLPVSADRVSLATGDALRLRVGPYADRAAAEAARLRTESITGAPGKVIVLDAAAPVSSATPPAKPAVSPTPAAKPDSKPVSAPEPPSTVVTAGFAVQLSAPGIEAEALALRDRARTAGFSSFVQRIETATGVRYRVRVGPVADRAAALAMRDAINGKLGTQGIVVSNP